MCPTFIISFVVIMKSSQPFYEKWETNIEEQEEINLNLTTREKNY